MESTRSIEGMVNVLAVSQASLKVTLGKVTFAVAASNAVFLGKLPPNWDGQLVIVGFVVQTTLVEMGKTNLYNS